MGNNFKGTNEKVKVVGNESWGINIVEGNFPIIEIDGFTNDQNEADAYNIADAIHVRQQIDCSLPELLERYNNQNNSLIAMMSAFEDLLKDSGNTNKPEDFNCFNKALAALNN